MAKGKPVNYALVKKDSKEGKAIYAMLNRLVEKHHEELTNARIAIAWNKSWQPDVDGRVTLGKCKRATDLDKELAAYDFVIILRAEFWQHEDVTDAQREALLDHECCHATVKYDADGEPARDERDRIVYRLRKHDIEEFEDVVRRHGCYKRDLEKFAAALLAAKQMIMPLGDDVAAKLASDPRIRKAIRNLIPKKGSGIDSVTFSTPGHEPVTLTPDDADAFREPRG